MRLDTKKVEEIVASFVKEKIPDVASISFEKIEFKDRFYEYWVNLFARKTDGITLCIFCRVEAGTGRIINYTCSVY
ncbi:MAG: hypothetical protein QXJ19_07695 [Candidatus Bathyarchaeia archaeon]|nr:hypothetical protein [Candidatus Bathyarchaeota archaeon]